MKIKSNVHFQYYNSRNLTFLYIFQINKKKKISRIHSAQYFFFQKKKSCKVCIWSNNMEKHVYILERKKKQIVKCMVIFYGIIILLL